MIYNGPITPRLCGFPFVEIEVASDLFVLLNDFLVLLFVDGHELYQLVIYMHEMMMQHETT